MKLIQPDRTMNNLVVHMYIYTYAYIILIPVVCVYWYKTFYVVCSVLYILYDI